MALVLILTAILFLILLVSLGFQPKFITRILGGLIFVVGIAGILLYGYGYCAIYGPSAMAVMRALFSVFCMFLGRNEISAVISQPLFVTYPALAVILYLVHLLALYATASTVVAGLGSRLLRILNLLFIHRKDINLVYGTSEQSVRFGEEIMDRKKGITIFVDAEGGEAFSKRIQRMGSILFDDDDSVTPTVAFLKRIGMRRETKRLSVYCLDENYVRNLKYAQNLLAALKEMEIDPAGTEITLLVQDEAVGMSLQAISAKDENPGQYGFGSVSAISRPDLIARLLVREYPPCETMRFTDSGEAAEDFTAVIIGFGNTGQAALRYLLMHAQFAGSRFRATIIADKYSQSAGSFFYKYPGIKDNYEIKQMEINARSVAFYDHLDSILHTLNYVVICTGNDRENSEIARDITGFLRARKNPAPVIMCSEQGINTFSDTDGLPNITNLYEPEVLCNQDLDNRAKVLNHQYHLSEGHTADEDWETCDYFSRTSCRASADFIDAMLHISKVKKEDLIEKGWPQDPVLLENLAKTEHVRWCAFHYAAGYQSMPEEVFNERGSRYQKEMKETGRSSVRIGKDTENLLHACLIPWDKLDELNVREETFTGKKKDYKQLDLDNVMMIPEILKQEKE